MKENEFLDGVSKIDTEIVEQYVEIDNKLQIREKRKSKKRILIRIAAVAACVAIIAGVLLIPPMFIKDKDTSSKPQSYDPKLTVIYNSSEAPKYYGDQGSYFYDNSSEIRGYSSIMVTAKYIDALPDTYVFFDDPHQNEYRILRMKTIKHYNGDKMTDEFFYLIPHSYMTDFSVYDQFFLSMFQCSWDYSILYNKSQNNPERLNLVLFSPSPPFLKSIRGSEFAAFDSEGNFDERLWNSNESWTESTKKSRSPKNIDAVLSRYSFTDTTNVALLDNITENGAKALAMISSLDNGIYIQIANSWPSKNSLLQARRYINGFLTNEKVAIGNKEVNKIQYGDELTEPYLYTKARFDENDLNNLPDLTSAYYKIINDLEQGIISPVHYRNLNQETINNVYKRVFAWYAKTETGVLGIIKVDWNYETTKKHYYDDAYFIIKASSSTCDPIDRDALLELIGEYETYFIYTGEYDEHGKVEKNICC